MRLIDAEFALKLAEDPDYGFESWNGNMQDVEGLLNNCPTIEAKPIVHAHWVSEDEAERMGHFEWSYCCSNCKEIFWDYTESFAFNYCPCCGAQMDEVTE